MNENILSTLDQLKAVNLQNPPMIIKEHIPDTSDDLVEDKIMSHNSNDIVKEDRLASSNGLEGRPSRDSSMIANRMTASSSAAFEEGFSQGSSRSSMPSTSNVLEAKATLGPANHKRRNGMLSRHEHDQLSTLLSTLRSIPQQNVEIKPSFKSLPISPYQRLQASGWKVKTKATALAKRRLAENPWAQLLASPIRMCQATGVRLPVKLMVGWNYVKNPKDDQIYLMPEELTDMTNFSADGMIRSPGSRFSEGVGGETTSSNSTIHDRLEDSPIVDVPTESLRSADLLQEEVANDGRKEPDSSGGDAEKPRSRPPIAPAKVHMRPSSILLLELNNKMLEAVEHDLSEGGTIPISATTVTGRVNRLLPNRWKEQARKFDKSGEKGDHQAGFLTTQETRKVRWHPNIHNVMLNLLRLRVLKALESTAVRNKRKTGIQRRTIPLPVLAGDIHDGSEVITSFSGIEQAVLLWIGTEQAAHSSIPPSSKSPPISPSTCHFSTLHFVPRNLPTDSLASLSAEITQETPVQTCTLIWTHNPPTLESDHDDLHQYQYHSVQQQQYTPPSISLILPTSNIASAITTSSSSSSSPLNLKKPTTNTRTRTLPVFDLSTLLGPSVLSKLHALARDNPSIRDAFGLPSNTTVEGETKASGWVMVKDGKGTNGFQSLVQEIWQLWLFVGGRNSLEQEEEAGKGGGEDKDRD